MGIYHFEEFKKVKRQRFGAEMRVFGLGIKFGNLFIKDKEWAIFANVKYDRDKEVYGIKLLRTHIDGSYQIRHHKEGYALITSKDFPESSEGAYFLLEITREELYIFKKIKKVSPQQFRKNL